MKLANLNHPVIAAAVLIGVLAANLFAAEPDKSSAELVSVLKSGASRQEKAAACRVLATKADKAAVAPLLALLADPELSHMARFALEPLPDPSVDKGFRVALKTLQGKQLVGVIGSIGVRHDTKAVSALSKLLTHQDAQVRQVAARALGRLATPSAAKALSKARLNAAPSDQADFCEALLRIADTALARNKPKDAIWIYDSMRKFGGSAAIRTAAWRGAILARGDEGLRLMSEALRQSDRAVFSAGLRTGAEIPGSAVTKELASVLGFLTAEKQVMVIQTLGKRKDPAATATLKTIAAKPEKILKLAAIKAMGEIGDAAAVPTLAGLVTSTDREIAEAAKEAFAAWNFDATDKTIRGWLSASSPEQKMLALEMIGRRRMKALLPELFTLASGTDQAMRAAALKRIGEIGGKAEIPNTLDLLLKATAAGDLQATEEAATLLASNARDPETASSQVQSRFAKANPQQKAALLRVLATVGGNSALSIVRGSLTETDPAVRLAAVRALTAWNNLEVAPDLLKVAQAAGDSTEKTIAYRAFLTIAGQAESDPARQLEMCSQAAALAAKDDEKKLLLSTLGKVNSPEAVTRINAYLQEGSVAEEACIAAVTLAERLIEKKNVPKPAADFAAALDKIAGMTSNADISKRSKAAAEKVRAMKD